MNKTNDMIVDGNSLYARAFWANRRDSFETDLVIRSCLLTLFSLINADLDRIGERIDRLAFCWDGDHDRDKGERQPKPDGYHETRDELMDVLTDVFGVRHTTPKAHEADDAIGTLVYRNWKKSNQIFVVSGDKDLMQLHGGNVHYYSLVDQALMSSSMICRKWNIKKPSQLAIVLAIMGDRVDNIKGIHGWGKKRVQKLFESVTPEMDFQEALETIADQIPVENQDAFWESLERTLLDNTVEGLVDLQPIQFAPWSRVDTLGLTGVSDSYSRLLSAYDPRSEEEDYEEL